MKENHDQHADQQTDQSNIVDNPVGSGDQHVDKSTGSFSKTDIPQTEPIQQTIRRFSRIPQPSTNIMSTNNAKNWDVVREKSGQTIADKPTQE